MNCFIGIFLINLQNVYRVKHRNTNTHWIFCSIGVLP